MIQPELNFTPSTYRTDHFSAEERSDLERSALSQEARVMAFYADGKAYGSSEVSGAVAKPREPLTSIRRAITTLVKRGLLVKTSETVTGFYGKQEHKYRKV